jgi:hypothetical protein
MERFGTSNPLNRWYFREKGKLGIFVACYIQRGIRGPFC